MILTSSLLCAVASRNNDGTVAKKANAWSLLGLMPSFSEAITVAQTDEWRGDRRTRLYHSCIDILAHQINYLTRLDMLFRFGDNIDDNIDAPAYFWIF
jgi:hypothetical protein